MKLFSICAVMINFREAVSLGLRGKGGRQKKLEKCPAQIELFQTECKLIFSITRTTFLY